MPFSPIRTQGNKTCSESALQMEGMGLSVPRGDKKMAWEVGGGTATDWLALGAAPFLYSRGRSREKDWKAVVLSVPLLSLPALPIWKGCPLMATFMAQGILPQTHSFLCLAPFPKSAKDRFALLFFALLCDTSFLSPFPSSSTHLLHL